MDEQYQAIIPGFEPLVPEAPQLPPPKKPPAAPITEPGLNQDDVRRVTDALDTSQAENTKRSHHARGLSWTDLETIRATACQPRKAGGNCSRMENVHTARARGLLDIAICSVIRDGMLRRSEAVELQWQDFEVMEDGTSRLHIRHSHPVWSGSAETVYLGEQATNDLLAIRRPDSRPEDNLFGISADSLSCHIRKACILAGLGDGYSGNSGRVGMAEDLSKAGATILEIMTAGRWKTVPMVAKHCRNQDLSRGAVHKFHQDDTNRSSS